MKDLKHLYTFEQLLESANNPLVRQAVDAGELALGYTCYHMPEVLLNLPGCFSVRLRAPLTGSMDIAGYYMANFICDYAKSLLERGIEGGYNFLSAIMGSWCPTRSSSSASWTCPSRSRRTPCATMWSS